MSRKVYILNQINDSCSDIGIVHHQYPLTDYPVKFMQNKDLKENVVQDKKCRLPESKNIYNCISPFSTEECKLSHDKIFTVWVNVKMQTI